MKALHNKRRKFLAFWGLCNFTFLAAFASVLSETKSAILDWMQRYGNSSAPLWKYEILFIFAYNIIIIFFWIVIQLFIVCLNNGAMRIAVGDDSDGKRIKEFQYLRAQAKKDVLIMGIGLSGVSKDINSIEEFLQSGKNITFLIMDPDVLVESPITSADDEMKAHQSNLLQQFQNTKITIDDKKFSEFYLTDNYRENIKTSVRNLQNLVERQKKRRDEYTGKWKEGTIAVYKYTYYIPLNVTISDMKESHSKLIIEFCLPFSTKRIRARFSHGRVKEMIENQIEELLNKAELICKN